MKLFRLLTGGDDAAFCHRVSAALSNGWELQGPPLLAFNSVEGKTICGQAVTKEVPGQDYDPDMKLSDY